MNTEKYSKLIEETIKDPEYKPLRPEELFGLLSASQSASSEGEPNAREECSESLEDFCSLLRALEAAGVLAFTKRGKVASSAAVGLITGLYHGTSKSFGFVTPDGGSGSREEDIFIPAKRSLFALDGDRVLVRRIEHDANGRDGRDSHIDMNKFYRKNGKLYPKPRREARDACPEGEVIRIVERRLESEPNIIGVYYFAEERRGRKLRRTAWVEPSSKRMPYSVFVDAARAEAAGAAFGDKVEVRVTRMPSEVSDLFGEITNVFGAAEDKGANYAAILAENGIETEFSDEVIAEAERSSERMISLAGRRDLRDRIIFTIDGADAKDLDDAISLEKTEGGYILGVHIADVSEYVSAGSLTDAEAMKRGTSVYFVDKVVPMLPRSLSNGACSLGGGLERYALSAFMTLDGSGNILETELCESVIRSRIRGVYSEVNDLFEKGDASEFFEKYHEVYPTLLEMKRLYAILGRRSEARGAVELETSEAMIVVGSDGSPIDITARERGDAERLIEQFMLCANEGVATYLTNLEMPCVYRIHEAPTEEKVENFSAFARGVGLDTRPLRAKKLHSSAFAAMLGEAKDAGLGSVVSAVMLRAMMKAKYSSLPSPHFGLSIDLYCHFTSPIRRYPDLSVHRIVKSILHGEAVGARLRELTKFAEESALRSSENELRALSAERDIEDLYKAIFMQKHIGEEFDAVISSVTSFGIFAELPNTVEGMIPVDTLDGIFKLDEKNHVLACGVKSYRLGQAIRVRVAASDVASRRVTFSIIMEN